MTIKKGQFGNDTPMLSLAIKKIVNEFNKKKIDLGHVVSSGWALMMELKVSSNSFIVEEKTDRASKRTYYCISLIPRSANIITISLRSGVKLVFKTGLIKLPFIYITKENKLVGGYDMGTLTKGTVSNINVYDYLNTRMSNRVSFYIIDLWVEEYIGLS